MATLESLVTRALSDQAFCEQITSDPEGTLEANGVEASPELVTALRGLDAASVQKLAAAFGKQQGAA